MELYGSLQAAHDVEVIAGHQIHLCHLGGGIPAGPAAGDAVLGAQTGCGLLLHGRLWVVYNLPMEYTKCTLLIQFTDGEQLLCPCVRRVGIHLLLRPHDGDLCALRADWNEAEAEPAAPGAAQTRLRCESWPKRAESCHQNAG